MFANIVEIPTQERKRNLPDRWHIRRKRIPVYAWLRKRISHSDWAEDLGRGISRKRNETMVSIINGQTPAFTITNEMLAEHELEIRTLYGTGKPRSDVSLFCIDVDVQKSQRLGSPEGAEAFIKWLTGKWFPGLYWERSRSGKGINGYFQLETAGMDVRAIRNHLKLLQKTLNAIALHHGFDVEAVEIKGIPAEAFWNYGRCFAVTQGTLMRLPRHLFENAEALMNTTVLSWNQMCDVIAYRPAPKVKPVHQCPVKNVRRSGSRVGFYFMVEKDLHLIQPGGHLHSWGESIVRSFGKGKKTIAISSRTVVSVEDIAVCLLILKFCAKHANRDGSMPWARIRACWNSLYEHGVIKRDFNDRRYAAIRRILDRMNWIKWERREYCPGYGAARWTLTDEAMGILDWEGDVRRVYILTNGTQR